MHAPREQYSTVQGVDVESRSDYCLSRPLSLFFSLPTICVAERAQHEERISQPQKGQGIRQQRPEACLGEIQAREGSWGGRGGPLDTHFSRNIETCHFYCIPMQNLPPERIHSTHCVNDACTEGSCERMSVQTVQRRPGALSLCHLVVYKSAARDAMLFFFFFLALSGGYCFVDVESDPSATRRCGSEES